MLTFSFTGVEGTMIQPELLTSGMVGKEIRFLFSPEWDGLQKTAVYMAGGQCVIRPGISDGDIIPAQVLEKPLEQLFVGVYGVAPDKSVVIPTIRAQGPRILPGVDPSGDPAADPGLPVWAEILQHLGDPEQLQTEQKNSLVAAVNELLRRLEQQENNQPEVPEGGSCDCESAPNPFAGKSALFFGDSLTEENYHYTKGYHAWIRELLELDTCHNYGRSGYKISDVYTAVRGADEQAQLVVVMCGVNDQTFSVPLGTMGDATTATTYGSLELLCTQLKTKYPASVIVFITPHCQSKYPHSGGITSYEIAKAIKEVCEKHAIPVYDNFTLSGIHSANLDLYTTDGCHWNDLGHELVGRNLARYLAGTFGYVPGVTAVPEVILTGIQAVFTQGGATIYAGTDLAELKPYLSVSALYSDGSAAAVTDYTLSGTLTEGTCSVAVSWGGMTGTFQVIVSGEDTPAVTLDHLTADFAPGDAVIYDSTPVEELRQYLTVTVHYSDGSRAPVTDYTLDTILQPGTATVTVHWGGKQVDFDLYVEQTPLTITGITALFQQDDAVIYSTDSLDSLKQYLTVTVHYSDGSSQKVSNYTLSGTLLEGSSTITAAYEEAADSFTVTVSPLPTPAREVEITGSKSANSFHLCLYVTREALPQVTESIITYGFDLEPLTEFQVTANLTGGIYLVDTINNLLAGYTMVGQSGMIANIQDNGDGTYSISGRQPVHSTMSSITQVADRAYWCLPFNTTFPVGSKFKLHNPWVKVDDRSIPIETIGGAFAEETCIVN